MGLGLFRRRLSAEERIEGLEMESEALSHEKEVAEKRAIIAQLKTQYGSRWRQILGVKGLDIATLRSFLVSANGGLRREQSRVGYRGGNGSRNGPGRGLRRYYDDDEEPERPQGMTLKEAVVPRSNAPSPLPGGHMRQL